MFPNFKIWVNNNNNNNNNKVKSCSAIAMKAPRGRECIAPAHS
jgi:hypothetical protein